MIGESPSTHGIIIIHWIINRILWLELSAAMAPWYCGLGYSRGAHIVDLWKWKRMYTLHYHCSVFYIPLAWYTGYTSYVYCMNDITTYKLYIYHHHRWWYIQYISLIYMININDIYYKTYYTYDLYIIIMYININFIYKHTYK